METTVISFKIESKFEDWVNIFDSKEAERRQSDLDIKLLLRGFSKDDSQKDICMDPLTERNSQKFVLDNIERIKKYKVDFSNMEELSWI